METKTLNINGNEYFFETLEELVLMLKDDDYLISLDIKKKGKIRQFKVVL